jgi:serpin B
MKKLSILSLTLLLALPVMAEIPKPAEPVKSGEPAKSAETAKPAEPAAPAETIKPAEPVKPAEAAKPVESSKSTEAPKQSSDPTTPAKPTTTSEPTGKTDKAEKIDGPKSASPDATSTPASTTTTASTYEQAADPSAFAKASNQFAFAMHQRLAKASGENLAFSPLSLASALAMTSAGAAGATEKEMLKALRLTGVSEAHKSAGAFLAALKPADDKTMFSAAQGIWLKKDMTLLPAFASIAKDQYHATSETLDFTATPKALEHLNGWVSKHTQERITNLFDAQSVGPGTQLVLASALYFKSQWLVPFKPEDTREGDFQLTAKKTAKGNFMHRTAKMDYAETPAFQALRLPYAGKDWAMVILLPRKVDGLAAIESNLTAESVEKTIGTLTQVKVDLSLPKFTTKKRLEIKGSLQKLGMNLAFSDDADFSRLSDQGKNLMISKVLHQTFVDVSEEGTEAAAATGIVMMPKGVRIQEETKVFHADHPFLYLIRHEPTGVVVFIGRLTNPETAREPTS